MLDALDVKSIIHRRKKRPLVAVKLHFGEKGNAAFIRPVYVRQVVDKIWDLGGRPFLTDANTVYVGTRSESVSHLTTAIENGFAYAVVRAPLVIADGLTGKAEVEVKINGEQFKSVFLAEAIVEAEALVTLTHFKLHELSGFGGALKNLGMGCASRKGKLSQHSNIAPKVTAKKCTGCGDCIAHCAQEAISINLETEKAVIDPKKCVGCAECILVCPYGNIQIQWNESIPVFLEKDDGIRLRRHDRPSATGACSSTSSPRCPRPATATATTTCPSWGTSASWPPGTRWPSTRPAPTWLTRPRGLAGSALKNKSPGADKFKDIYPQVDWPIQLEYAEKLGLGSREYELIKV